MAVSAQVVIRAVGMGRTEARLCIPFLPRTSGDLGGSGLCNATRLSRGSDPAAPAGRRGGERVSRVCTWASIRQTHQRGIYNGGCAGPTQTHCSRVAGVCCHKAPQELGLRKRSEGVFIMWRVKMQSSQVEWP